MAFAITHSAKHDPKKKPIPKQIEFNCKITQQDYIFDD
jgi:hypothetical protein